MADLLGRNIGTNYKGFLNTAGDANTPFGTTFIGITDGMGNDSALQLNLAQTNGFIRVNAQTSYTSGVYLSVNNAVIGDFRADATNGFAMVAQGSYPISFYTNNTAILAGRFTAAGNLVVGHTTASARLHVRGDGTNPIARFEDNSGQVAFQLLQSGHIQISNASLLVGLYPLNSSSLTIDRNGFGVGFNNVSPSGTSYFFTNALSKTPTSGTSVLIKTQETFAAAAGSANYRHIEYNYTINNSGAQTGTATGIFLNATETALNSMTHNLMDLQRGGVSQFRVDRLGGIIAAGLPTTRPSTVGAFYQDTAANILANGDKVVGIRQ